MNERTDESGAATAAAAAQTSLFRHSMGMSDPGRRGLTDGSRRDKVISGIDMILTAGNICECGSYSLVLSLA